MKPMYEFFAIVIAGAITENLLFARALGVDKIAERTRSYKNILRFGVLYGFVAVLGGALSWGMRTLLSGFKWWNTVRGLAVMFGICAAYLLMTFIVGTRKVKTSQSLPVVAAFNGASFGVVFIATVTKQTFVQAMAYCVGGTLGLTLAMMLVHSGRERLELCRVPKSFTGIPITMIYIGILSLAIYGLVGHQLPT